MTVLSRNLPPLLQICIICIGIPSDQPRRTVIIIVVQQKSRGTSHYPCRISCRLYIENIVLNIILATIPHLKSYAFPSNIRIGYVQTVEINAPIGTIVHINSYSWVGAISINIVVIYTQRITVYYQNPLIFIIWLSQNI